MKYEIINNYKINAFSSKEDFLNEIEDQKKILIAMNAEKIIKDNKELREIVNNNISYTDGIGSVIALSSKGLKSIKLPGSELWLDIINKFHMKKTFYFIGATTEVIDHTVERLKVEYPRINIIGYRNGFLKNGDKEKLNQELQSLKPDVVFVAQGSPKQEFLMDELSQKYKALYMGLGGSFDIYGGEKKRAPMIFLKLELEWLYRLLKEPTRFSRQLALVKFLVYIFKGYTKKEERRYIKRKGKC